MQPATNVALRLMRPSLFLSATIFFWGVVMTLHGVASNYGGLIGLRFALGLAEAGLYPGIVFYLSWCGPISSACDPALEP